MSGLGAFSNRIPVITFFAIILVSSSLLTVAMHHTHQLAFYPLFVNAVRESQRNFVELSDSNHTFGKRSSSLYVVTFLTILLIFYLNNYWATLERKASVLTYVSL